MAIISYSEQQLFDQAMAYFRAIPQFATRDLSEYGFLGLLARSFAQTALSVQDSIRQADNDGTPAYQVGTDGVVRVRSSEEALDQWAFVFGVSNGSGGYGRRGAIAAKGGSGTPTCAIGGTLIAAGSQLTDSSGVVVATTSNITTDGPPNTVIVNLVAVTAGLGGNLPVGSVLSWTAPPAGVASTMVLTVALTGGADRESGAQLLDRILQRLQNPPKGGTAGDYRRWAEESKPTDSLDNPAIISRAYVYPLRKGLGTVDIYITQAGSGLARWPAIGVDVSVRNYVNLLRPVTARIYVNNPSAPNDQALKIRCRVTPTLAEYDYDWDDGAIGTPILSATASTVVILDGNFDPDLKNAIDAGLKPRIQIQNTTTGAKATPYVVQVASYQIGVPAAGQDTMAFVSGQTVSPVPTAGDIFWAGAPFVADAAQAVLDFVDGLGPSRVSGYADAADPWQDRVARAGIVHAVLGIKDADGTPFAKNVWNLVTDGVEIAVGAGAYAVADYQPRDLFGFPELAYVATGGIAVIKARP